MASVGEVIGRTTISAIDTKTSSAMAYYKWTLASIKNRREVLIFVLLLLICVFHLAVWWVHHYLELLYSISHLVAVDGDDPLTSDVTIDEPAKVGREGQVL